MISSISIPAINTLKSADSTAIREITMSLIFEIDKLNKKIEDMEADMKKASENRRGTRYGV
jgi:uncharacterized membrane protein YjjP (DUF1212 family)